jgi:hypothetical protein
MKVDRALLTAIAASLDARPDMVEKVIQLLGLLNNLTGQPKELASGSSAASSSFQSGSFPNTVTNEVASAGNMWPLKATQVHVKHPARFASPAIGRALFFSVRQMPPFPSGSGDGFASITVTSDQTVISRRPSRPSMPGP